MLIDVLLVVGDDRLGDSLTDGVDLGSVTTTGNTNTDVDTGELVVADDQEGLVDLKFNHESSESCSSLFLPLPKIAGSRCIGGAGDCWSECAYLEAEDLGLDQGERLAVNLDEALSLL